MADFSFTAKDKPNAQDLNRENVREQRYSQELARKVSEAITALPSDAVDVSISVRGEDVHASHVREDGTRADGKTYSGGRDYAEKGAVSVSSRSGNVPSSAIVGTPEGLIREDTHGDLSKGFDKKVAGEGVAGARGVPGEGGAPGELERRTHPARGFAARLGPDNGERRAGDTVVRPPA